MNASVSGATACVADPKPAAATTGREPAKTGDQTQPSEFSNVLDKTQPPAADAQAGADHPSAAPAKESKSAAKTKADEHAPAAPAAAVPVAGNESGSPLPPWLALLPPMPAVSNVATPAAPATATATATAATSPASDPAPVAAASAASVTAATTLAAAAAPASTGKTNAKPAAGAPAVASADAGPGTATPGADPQSGVSTTETAALAVAAKPGDATHDGAADAAKPAQQFLDALLSASDVGKAAAPQPRPDILMPSAHAADPTSAQAPGTAAAGNNSIQVPVQNPQWADAFAARVVWQAGQDLQQAHLHLNPPELGPVEVKLAISDDKINAQFVTHHIETRQAIQDAIPRLRELMSQSGMNLMNANVFQQGTGGHGGQQAALTPAFPDVAAGEEAGADAGPLTRGAPVHLGLIDAYV